MDDIGTQLEDEASMILINLAIVYYRLKTHANVECQWQYKYKLYLNYNKSKWMKHANIYVTLTCN